jgi:hypothetical protein
VALPDRCGEPDLTSRAAAARGEEVSRPAGEGGAELPSQVAKHASEVDCLWCGRVGMVMTGGGWEWDCGSKPLVPQFSSNFTIKKKIFCHIKMSANAWSTKC